MNNALFSFYLVTELIQLVL